jgi:YVTN family beta-propeller protein
VHGSLSSAANVTLPTVSVQVNQAMSTPKTQWTRLWVVLITVTISVSTLLALPTSTPAALGSPAAPPILPADSGLSPFDTTASGVGNFTILATSGDTLFVGEVNNWGPPTDTLGSSWSLLIDFGAESTLVYRTTLASSGADTISVGSGNAGWGVQVPQGSVLAMGYGTDPATPAPFDTDSLFVFSDYSYSGHCPTSGGSAWQFACVEASCGCYWLGGFSQNATIGVRAELSANSSSGGFMWLELYGPVPSAPSVPSPFDTIAGGVGNFTILATSGDSVFVGEVDNWGPPSDTMGSSWTLLLNFGQESTLVYRATFGSSGADTISIGSGNAGWAVEVLAGSVLAMGYGANPVTPAPIDTNALFLISDYSYSGHCPTSGGTSSQIDCVEAACGCYWLGSFSQSAPAGIRAELSTNSSSGGFMWLELNGPAVPPDHVEVGSNPGQAALDPNGSQVWVTDVDSRAISVVNTTSLAVVRTIFLSVEPFGIAFSPNGSAVWVSGRDPNTAVEISTTNYSVIATVAIPVPDAYAYMLAVSPNGSQVWVTDYYHNITIINATSATILTEFLTLPYDDPGFMTAISFSNDGQSVYIGYTASDNSSMGVVDYNATTRTINWAQGMGGGISFPGVLESRNGSEVFAVNDTPLGTAFTVLNATTGAVIATHPMPTLRTEDFSTLAESPDGSAVWFAASHPGSNAELVAVYTASALVAGMWADPTVSGSTSLTLAADGGTAYCPTDGGSSYLMVWSPLPEFVPPADLEPSTVSSP